MSYQEESATLEATGDCEDAVALPISRLQVSLFYFIN